MSGSVGPVPQLTGSMSSEPVVVGVRIERVAAVRDDLTGVGELVAVGVDGQWIGAVGVDLVAVAQRVVVRIGIVVVRAEGRLLVVGEPVTVEIDRLRWSSSSWWSSWSLPATPSIAVGVGHRRRDRRGRARWMTLEHRSDRRHDDGGRLFGRAWSAWRRQRRARCLRSRRSCRRRRPDDPPTTTANAGWSDCGGNVSPGASSQRDDAARRRASPASTVNAAVAGRSAGTTAITSSRVAGSAAPPPDSAMAIAVQVTPVAAELCLSVAQQGTGSVRSGEQRRPVAAAPGESPDLRCRSPTR